LQSLRVCVCVCSHVSPFSAGEYLMRSALLADIGMKEQLAQYSFYATTVVSMSKAIPHARRSWLLARYATMTDVHKHTVIIMKLGAHASKYVCANARTFAAREKRAALAWTAFGGACALVERFAKFGGQK
jgi:hypothetical protein